MKNSGRVDSLLSAHIKELEKKLEITQTQLHAVTKENEELVSTIQKNQKKLLCNNQFSLIFSDANIKFEEAIAKILKCITLSLRYPDLAGVMIELDNKKYKTENFKTKNVYTKKHAIVVAGEKIGMLAVCYPKSKFDSGEEIWHQEETEFLQIVKGRIGNVWLKFNRQIKSDNDERMHVSMLESLPDSILVTDLYGKVVYYSPRSPQVFGYPEGTDLKGYSIFRFLEDKEHTRAAKLIEDMLSGKNSGAIGYIGNKADNSTFEIEVNGELIRDDDGNVVNMIFVTRDISERKKIEHDLLESERMLSLMMKNLPGIAYRCLNNVDWIMVYMSDGCFDLTGYMAETFTGEEQKPYADIIHPEDRAYVAKAVSDALNEDRSFEVEYRIITAEGEIKFVWEKGQGVLELGRLSHIEGLIIDITKRIKAETDLRKSEQKYRAVFENIQDVYYETTLDGVILEVSPSVEDLSRGKYKREDLLGKLVYDFYADARAREVIIEELYRSGKVKDIEVELVSGIELQVFVAISATIHYDQDGKPQKIVGSIQDITHQKEIQKEIRLSEERYRTIFENIQDTYYEASLDGIITEISPTIKTLSKGLYEREELIGKSVLDIYAFPEERSEFLQRISTEGKVSDFELMLQNKDGMLIPAAVTATFQKDENGQPIKIVGNIRDITERRKAAEELKQSEEKYKSVFNKSQSVMLIVDPETGEIIDANIAACKYYGWSYDELTSKTVYDINSLDKQTLKARLSYNNTDEKKHLLFKHQLANGEERDVEVFQNPVTIGDQIYVYEIIHDITDRVRAEKALFESEQNLNKSQEIANMGSWEFNFLSGEVKWSKNMYKIVGYQPGEIEPTYDFLIQNIHPADRKMFDLNIDLSKQKSYSNEYRFIKRTGEIIWLKNNFITVFKAGEVVALQGTNIDITERKKAEQALAKSEQDLKISQSIAQMGSWEFDLKTKETTWSENYYKMVGLKPEEVDDPFKQFVSMLDPGKRDMVDKLINDAPNTDKPIETEMKLNLPEGRSVWIQNRTQAEFEDGVAVRLRGVFLDVTAKRESEQIIIEQNERFSAVLDSIPDLIFIVDRAGKFKEYYCSADQELLLPREMILKSDISNVFAGEELKFHKQKLEESFTSGELVSYDYSQVVGNKVLFYQARIKKIAENRAIIIVQDITEKYLQDQEVQKLSLAVQQSPAMTIITDLQGNIEYVNAAFEKITGYSFLEVEGKNPSILQSGKTTPATYKSLWSSLRSGRQWRGEWQNRKKNGSLYWEDVIVMPFKDEKGITSKYLAVKLDITDRKVAEQEILELNAGLEKKVEERTLELSELNSKLLFQIEEQKRVEKELRWNQTLLESMSNNSPLGFMVVDPNTYDVIYKNRRFDEIWELEHVEHHSGHVLNFETDIKPGIKSKLVNPALYQEYNRVLVNRDDISILEDVFSLTGNRTVKRYTAPLSSEDGEYFGRLFIYEDITQQRKEAVFQRELLDLSAQLTGIPYHQFVTAINTALKKIGELTLADRAYIFEFDDADKKFISNTYEWVREGVSSEKENLQHIPIALFPNGLEVLEDGRNIIIPNSAQLPEGYDDLTDMLEAQQIKSLIEVPLLSENTLIGFAGLDFVKDHRMLTESEMKNLRLWSTMLAALINNLKLESLLELSRQNYSTFFNTIDDFLLVVDKSGKILHMNDTVTNRLGYSYSELIGKSALSIWPEEVKKEAEYTFGKMLKGESSECSLPIKTVTGKQIMVETRIKEGVWNETPSLFVISKDISTIKLSEEKFSKAFHSAVSLLAISDAQTHKLIEVNKTWLRILGYSREEVIGKTPKELGILVDPAQGEIIKEKLLNNQPVRDIEINYYSKNKEVRTGLFSAEELNLGQSKSVLTVIVDITERKKMELELLNARTEAEKANEAKSEFLSRMSHELRTPLNSILGFAQLLERSMLNPKQLKATKHIHGSGKHLLNLINEVLDISRIEAGRMQLSLEPVSLPKLIRQVVDLIEPQAQEKDVRVKFAENKSVGEFVQADNQRMKQVLLNLFSNAVKYNKTGGTVKISTENHLAETGLMIRIKVTDTGSGIKKEDSHKVFTPFERIGAENSVVEGTGLGLSVTKKLVEAMNGHIGVESLPGKGSTFWVDMLPVAEVEGVLHNAIGKHGIPKKNESVKGTIVYVEDNLSNIELVEQIVSQFRPGILLKPISNGKNAFKFILENKADMILLDLNLPGLKGDKILKQLKGNNEVKEKPVIILSANAMPEKINELLDLGADNYIPKPIDVVVFLRIVDTFFKH